MPHSGVAAACADSWNAVRMPGTSGLVDTETSTVARSDPRGAVQLTIVVL